MALLWLAVALPLCKNVLVSTCQCLDVFSTGLLRLLQGPKDTPYEGGTFELSISVPEQYPLVAPTGVAFYSEPIV